MKIQENQKYRFTPPTTKITHITNTTINNVRKTINIHYSFILLNINVLNSPNKKTQKNKMKMKKGSIILQHPRTISQYLGETLSQVKELEKHISIKWT